MMGKGGHNDDSGRRYCTDDGGRGGEG